MSRTLSRAHKFRITSTSRLRCCFRSSDEKGEIMESVTRVANKAVLFLTNIFISFLPQNNEYHF